MARQQLDVFRPRAWHLARRVAAIVGIHHGHDASVDGDRRGDALPIGAVERQRRGRLVGSAGVRRRRAGRDRGGQQTRSRPAAGSARAHPARAVVEAGLRPSAQAGRRARAAPPHGPLRLRRACQRVERVAERGGVVERTHRRQQAVGARQVGDALVAACLGQRQVARLGRAAASRSSNADRSAAMAPEASAAAADSASARAAWPPPSRSSAVWAWSASTRPVSSCCSWPRTRSSTPLTSA